jgi:hypothetical protein
VGAQLAPRNHPFQGFSRHSPTDLGALAWATEAKEALALVAKVRQKKPPKQVATQLSKVEKDARAVERALKAAARPQARYGTTLAARDALLPAWTKAMSKLKKHAAAAWDEDEATYKAIFAPPERVQAPAPRRRRTPAPADGTPRPT